MERKELLNKFADAHKHDGLPPLANKIVGVFYLSNEKYLGFDDIVDLVDASKGAVSKALKLLMSIYRINHIQDPTTSRKRLFYLDPDGAEKYIKIVAEGLSTQNELIKELNQFRTNGNNEMSDFIERTIAFNGEAIAFLLKNSERYFKK
ncbi:hypothetical protein [Flammeovirga kamogawensis]|uniref:MarR family transcriptional regulator n=1 Tax=Flammeovirga kamogawensis TaxID=373891 RepID=A0ABX8H1W4_9BACT|nr:hypothetical protein [Flammeovirga kamogawensis]MBB6462212.1 DNA-binding transcriptional regulator GbsR (MarR family) [Flammeovirga kamogawensis]QWG09387.1 hypothetical protein KM029_22535 [Flammeovirga kamogawensis]TRX64905.1 hypothetical protein EO216_20445 [Flammeovirga kamogawensis]